ncbi:MAG TPA: Rieske 2Fe-2S domain-containing protein [Chloroflexota bacterium]|nr:Rieske 2Fe-2S domain-containing protein [Chloroflexota bacterium]
MLTREANERLAQVGPGTPGGNLLRRYWHPIATLVELEKEPVLPVKLLGENLALYKSPDGDMGLMAERCPHRGASMVYGIPEDGGLRCPYHGWKFSDEGICLEQPAEPETSTFKHRVRIPAYPVQEMGGLIWAYLGPAPAPILPKFDLFVRDDIKRSIGITVLPCNWVQMMENSLDPVHLEYLHGMLTNYTLKRQGKPPSANVKHHLKIGFDVWKHGISKRRLLEGQAEDCDDWTRGHPILFPNILAVGDESCPEYQIRVPMDDTTTLYYWYNTSPLGLGEDVQKSTDIPIWENPYQHDNGRLIVETVNGQDMMAFLTQGPISLREAERLGTSDKGVILFRSIVFEQMEKVARGEDPLGVLRDPADDVMIRIPRESKAHYVVGEFIAADDENMQPAIKKEYTRTVG